MDLLKRRQRRGGILIEEDVVSKGEMATVMRAHLKRPSTRLQDLKEPVCRVSGVKTKGFNYVYVFTAWWKTHTGKHWYNVILTGLDLAN